MLGARRELTSCLRAQGKAGAQVSVPESSVKIEVRKGNLLSNGTAGTAGLGQPLPQQLGGEDGNPRAKHSREAGQLPYSPGWH